MVENPRRELRLLYALGPGDAIFIFQQWRKGNEGVSQTSLTYSGQFFELCRQKGYQGYAISSYSKPGIESAEFMIVENRPKRFVGRGLRYHVSQVLYGISIVATAITWRANYVIVDSGTTHWALLAVLRLLNIRVVAVLHNVPWPTGYKPRTFTKRLLLKADGWFWRRIVYAVISVSPECERQVRELAGVFRGRAIQCRAQFRRGDFAGIDPPLRENSQPLCVVFAGRAEPDKGVLDIVEIARRVEEKFPGQTRFDICGDGSALNELRRRITVAGVQGFVHVHGRLNRIELLSIYARSHVFLVPTRSTFSEGMPMVCAEGVLCGRPVIAPPVTNTKEVLDGAILWAETDNVQSYADKIGMLIENPRLYQQLRESCTSLQEQFYDRDNSLTEAMAKAIDET